MKLDPVDTLRELVAIPSLSGDELAAAEYLVERMAKLGFDARVDAAGNAVGVRRGPGLPSEDPREVVLLGHLDTVPGDVPQKTVGDRMYGRGTVDAKGPLCAFVHAVAACEPAPGTALVVIGAVEEECPTSKGARFVTPNHRPEACIIGEPSGWDGITLGYKGRLLFEYHLAQPGGHGAGPLGAVAERAADFWLALRLLADRFNEGRDKLFDQLMASLPRIRTESDGLTDEVRMTVGFRLPPDFDVDELVAEAQRLAGPATLEVRGREVAFTSPRTSPLARSFARAVRAHDGEPRFKHKTGTSDMNVLGPVWQCPMVAYGPGDSLLDHTPEEHVSIAEYKRSIDVLRAALVEAGYARK